MTDSRPDSQPQPRTGPRGYQTPYSFTRQEPYDPEEFLGFIDDVSDRYFIGFHHPVGKRLLAGDLTPDELRIVAAQERPYYAETTWWNAGKLVNATTLDEQRRLHGALLDELGMDLLQPGGDPSHSELHLRFCDGLGLDRGELLRTPLTAAGVLALTELRRITTQRPVFEALAASNLVIERQRPAHYTRLLEALRTHYPWIPESALRFYVVHAELDGDHSSIGRDVVRRYVREKRDQDAAFSAVLRSLCLRTVFYDGIESLLLGHGGPGMVPWPGFPGEPWPRPAEE